MIVRSHVKLRPIIFTVFLSPISLDRSTKRMPIDINDALKKDAEEDIKSMEAHKLLQLETWPVFEHKFLVMKN